MTHQIFLNFRLHSVYGFRIVFPAPLGGVAQLGERLTGSQEVRGSIPLVSTMRFKASGKPEAFYIYASDATFLTGSWRNG